MPAEIVEIVSYCPGLAAVRQDFGKLTDAFGAATSERDEA